MLRVRDLYLRYDNSKIIEGVSFELTKGSITSLIGPNGCGKSTIFKALCKSKSPDSGEISYKGKLVHSIKPKAFAKEVAILPQNPKIPEDFSVKDLVGYGRYPHLDWSGRLKAEDRNIIDWAIDNTKLNDLVHRQVSTLSGGERQRAWMAMALAQQPKLLLLDEPTTFLDISHQYDILELIKSLNQDLGITILMVLHDLNQAARYSHKMIALCKGKIYREGTPYEVIREDMIRDVFSMQGRILEDEQNQCPYFIPTKSVERGD